MSFNKRLNVAQLATASTGIAGASGTVVTGNPVTLAAAQHGSISALVTLIVETNTVTLAPKWQVSNDNVTYYDVQGNTGTTRTGTGSTATTTEVLVLNAGCVWRYARVAVVVGVTTAVVTKEFFSVSYNYLTPAFV